MGSSFLSEFTTLRSGGGSPSHYNCLLLPPLPQITLPRSPQRFSVAQGRPPARLHASGSSRGLSGRGPAQRRASAGGPNAGRISFCDRCAEIARELVRMADIV